MISGTQKVVISGTQKGDQWHPEGTQKGTQKDDPEFAARAAEHPAFEQWPLVVVVDDAAKATATTAAFLWT
ncbi:MAG: hypothetical protein DRJ61_00635, partial [Acidobacteria bacterium]